MLFNSTSHHQVSLITWLIYQILSFVTFNSSNLHTGEMISEMLGQGYDISATKLISFTHASAAEFLEVYKGVLSHSTNDKYNP